MQLIFNDEKPIYIQLAENIEDSILSGAFPTNSQIPSTTELSVTFKINPATSLKGINLLVDKNVIYKKRGVGMFVNENAQDIILTERKENFYQTFITSMLEEAKKIGITKDEVINLIERNNQK